ncbi:MAG: NAD(P)/FAD-dependent oxidoreductase [bacterium]
MRLQIQQVSVPLNYDDSVVVQRVARKVGCQPSDLINLQILRRSLDARPRNPEPVFVLSVAIDLRLEVLPKAAHLPSIEILDAISDQVPSVPRPLKSGVPPPIVVGAGPAGLMAAYKLAMAGARPILIERGEAATERGVKVARFWLDGTLDPESNVLYGEGGAGLFSDGKLTARSKERGRIREFMELLHACGADNSVLIDSEPHVGSDALLNVVPQLRQRIIDAGGEVRFGARLEQVIIEKEKLHAVVINGQTVPCSHCVLAVGHSARDVYEMLAKAGVELTPKPFAVGVRLELPQATIDRAQYGRFAGSPLLGAANFRLTRRGENGIRACYSFCMCPGGKVISCASEPGLMTTNGMSYSKRSLPMGNAAFLVPVEPSDYPAHEIPALAGLAFQRELEQSAFAAAGGHYDLPATRLVDFLAGKASIALPENRSCQRTVPLEFRTILPEFVVQTLFKAIPPMLKELNGTKLDEVILYAPETRSSSPLWITRNPECESTNTRGLYPVGEGAGYAGGIVSSALDGMRAAEHVLSTLA